MTKSKINLYLPEEAGWYTNNRKRKKNIAQMFLEGKNRMFSKELH